MDKSYAEWDRQLIVGRSAFGFAKQIVSDLPSIDGTRRQTRRVSGKILNAHSPQSNRKLLEKNAKPKNLAFVRLWQSASRPNSVRSAIFGTSFPGKTTVPGVMQTTISSVINGRVRLSGKTRSVRRRPALFDAKRTAITAGFVRSSQVGFGTSRT